MFQRIGSFLEMEILQKSILQINLDLNIKIILTLQTLYKTSKKGVSMLVQNYHIEQRPGLK